MSTSGDERVQGFEIWQGNALGPVPPQGMGAGHVADSSTYLWQIEPPADLPIGAHAVEFTTIMDDGREYIDLMTFEVREARPQPVWDASLWAGADD